MSSSDQPRSKRHPKPTSSSTQDALRAKQTKRKFKGTSTPDSALSVSLETFTAFTNKLSSSTRICALIGAGLSVSSGMTTFRGNDRFWRDLEPSDLSEPKAFSNDPAKVWWFFSHRMKVAQEASPNRGHVALARLAKEKEGFFAINQNIDGLCERAGFTERQMARVHGSLWGVKCSNESCDYSAEVTYPINEALTVPTDADISDPSVPLPDILSADLPTCPVCAHLLRPDVVFFGEPIARKTLNRVWEFLSLGKIDLMLVVGTSCIVLPASMYVQRAKDAGARIAVFDKERIDETSTLGNWEEDWYFEGDAAEMVPEMLKGVVGNL